MDRFQHLLKLLADSPNDSFLLFALAKECEGKARQDQALDYYLRLQAADENYVGLYYHLGKLYEKFQKTDQAILTYKKGIEISKKAGDHHAAAELAGALLEIDDSDEA